MKKVVGMERRQLSWRRGLAEFTGAEINRAFPKAERRRTFSDVGVPEEVTRVYDKLCDLAGFHR